MNILARALTSSGRRIGEGSVRWSIATTSLRTNRLRLGTYRSLYTTRATATTKEADSSIVQQRQRQSNHQHRQSSYMSSAVLFSALGIGTAIILLDPEPLFSSRSNVMAEGASHDNQKWGPRLDANLALIRRTFEDRSTLSLLRSLLIYEVCAYPQLVTLASKVINLAENMPLLNLPVRFAVRETAFRQFCGGETVEETLPLLTRMHRQNISGILDLSIEADISEATRNMTEDAAAAARGESTTYWRNNREGQATRADHVMSLIERGIRAGKAAPGTFFAVKCTALASDPEIFEQWSVALRNARREFDELTGRQNIEQQQQQQQEPQQQQQKEQQTKILNPPVNPNEMNVKHLREQLEKHTIDESDFIALAWPYLSTKTESGIPMSANETERQLKTIFHQLDTRKRGRIDWVDYVQLFNSERLRNGQIRLIPDETEKCQNMTRNTLPDKVDQNEIYCCLHPDTQAEMLEALARLERLCEASIAHEAGETSVRLMIDAEQSYLQPAIAYMARQVARKYNQRDDATPPQIYDTYQLYLRQGLKNLVEDMVMAERNGYHWAGKLVRGAYVSTEQRYAHKHNQTNAIWPSKPDTDRSYDIGAAMAIEQANQGSAHVVVATHNNRSVARAMKLMERLDQQRKANEAGQQSLRQRIHFAQLLGMGELIMTRILEQGYQSAKYVPYGPVQEVVPYLLRRAEENGAMFVTPNEIASTPEEMEVDIDAGMPGEDRNAIIHILRERLGWRRWFGLRQV